MKVILTENQLKALLREMSSEEIDERMDCVNLNPTEGQKKAGNYSMAHISIKGMKISIENPKGSYRRGVDEKGNKWENMMHNHYGYFNITKGKDGDAVDVFIGPNVDDFENIYCVDQNNKKGEFDETKVMLGFNSKEEAKEAYLSNYSPNWKGFREITGVSLETFKKWLYRGRKQRQPFAEYVEIQKKKVNENIEQPRIGNPQQYEIYRDYVEKAKGVIQGFEMNMRPWKTQTIMWRLDFGEVTQSLLSKAVSKAIKELQDEGFNLKYQASLR